MKKGAKNFLINFTIILGIILLSIILLRNSEKEVEKETAKCIGQHSTFYTQEGCSHCKTQKNLFGENYIYLNEIDCTETPEKCFNISGTPTWIINEKEYKGLQSIEKLKNLTKC